MMFYVDFNFLSSLFASKNDATLPCWNHVNKQSHMENNQSGFGSEMIYLDES